MRYGDSVYVTAPTGIAALNIGGITIHKYAGLGCSSNYKLNDLKKKANVYKWRATKVLIIDEISMLDGKLFDILNLLAKYCRKNDNKPFGGIQLILSGDFFQLPPVGLDKAAIYCFEANCWNETIQKSFVLSKVFRQKEMGLTNILAEIREGVLSQKAIKLLSKCGSNANCNDIKPTRLFALNKYVEQTNLNFLNQINSKLYTFNAVDNGDDYLIKYLKSECNAQDILQLKIGCQVVLLRNLDVSEGLCNGSRGVIIRFEKGTGEGLTYPFYPIVRFKSKNKGTKEIVVKEELWTVEDKGRVAIRAQLPLKLAWALSIHKSQGMTIDSLEVDLNGVFEYGQCYVALSRARSLDGLIVKGLNPNKVKCNDKVKEFYNKLLNNKK